MAGPTAPNAGTAWQTSWPPRATVCSARAARLRPDPLPARRHAPQRRTGRIGTRPAGLPLGAGPGAPRAGRPRLGRARRGQRLQPGRRRGLAPGAAIGRLRHQQPGPTRAAVPGTQLLVPLVHGHAQGAATVRDSRREFTRYMWDTWSPAGWYEEADFDEAARAFDNPDWAEVVLHSYRQRWGHAQGDPAYAEDAARLTPAPVLAVPTLVLHGGPTPATRPPRPRARTLISAAAINAACWTALAISATRGAAGGGPGHPEILRTGLKPGAGSVRTRLVSRPAPLHAPE